MNAAKLYSHLEKDFIKPGLSDEWAKYMGSIADFITDDYKERSMGLVCDFASEIGKVYTAVFPSERVMKRILAGKANDALLFVHHPSIWDIRKAPEVFQQMDRSLLEQFKQRRISIYNLHVPLDNYGKFSTSVSLAEVLGIKPTKPFAPYFGSLSGVIGKTGLATANYLKKKFEKVVGHKVSLYQYGDDEIKSGNVAIIAGGGNEVKFLADMAKEGVNTFITGITAKNDHSRPAHEFAMKNRINLLGGTHYSTEKFACIAITGYFSKLGMPSEFLEDKPVMEDM